MTMRLGNEDLFWRECVHIAHKSMALLLVAASLSFYCCHGQLDNLGKLMPHKLHSLLLLGGWVGGVGDNLGKIMGS
jgi:hypothetical protein